MSPTYLSPTESTARWTQAAFALAQRPGVLLDLGGGTSYQGLIQPQWIGPETDYLCLDIAQDAAPSVVGDALTLPLGAESIDAIFCNAVLEHVRQPHTAVEEMYRVLAPGGMAMVAVPFIYPFHDRVDYFRFSEMALRELFTRFQPLTIVPVGDYLFATWMFLTGFRYVTAVKLDRWFSGIRIGLRFGLTMYNKLASGSQTRDYMRSLQSSPVGWHVYAEKPAYTKSRCRERRAPTE